MREKKIWLLINIHFFLFFPTLVLTANFFSKNDTYSFIHELNLLHMNLLQTQKKSQLQISTGLSYSLISFNNVRKNFQQQDQALWNTRYWTLLQIDNAILYRMIMNLQDVRLLSRLYGWSEHILILRSWLKLFFPSDVNYFMNKLMDLRKN